MVDVPRSTQRYVPKVPDDELRLIQRMTALALQFGRYGYRRITALLRHEGWQVNSKRIARLWRQEGLKVPQRATRSPFIFANFGRDWLKVHTREF